MIPVLVASVLCVLSFVPAVCNLDDRQQVSLGVLFTVIAFHLGLKSMDVYPKVAYIMFIDKFFLLNMFVMALCVLFNSVSYMAHGTCDESKEEYETRSAIDWILLGVIIGIWILWNSYIFSQSVSSERDRKEPEHPELTMARSQKWPEKKNSIFPG